MGYLSIASRKQSLARISPSSTASRTVSWNGCSRLLRIWSGSAGTLSSPGPIRARLRPCEHDHPDRHDQQCRSSWAGFVASTWPWIRIARLRRSLSRIGGIASRDRDEVCGRWRHGLDRPHLRSHCSLHLTAIAEAPFVCNINRVCRKSSACKRGSRLASELAGPLTMSTSSAARSW